MEFEKCAIMSGFRRSGHIIIFTYWISAKNCLRQFYLWLDCMQSYSIKGLSCNLFLAFKPQIRFRRVKVFVSIAAKYRITKAKV